MEIETNITPDSAMETDTDNIYFEFIPFAAQLILKSFALYDLSCFSAAAIDGGNRSPEFVSCSARSALLARFEQCFILRKVFCGRDRRISVPRCLIQGLVCHRWLRGGLDQLVRGCGGLPAAVAAKGGEGLPLQRFEF